MTMPDTPSEIIPAATLIVMRDRNDGPPQLLFVERSPAMRFAGGALVFPGGRIDAADDALAAEQPGGLADAAARIAAVRETIEEAGVAIGIDGDARAMQRALNQGKGLADIVGPCALALDRLVPFARWLPMHPMVRVFDTRFYLARWNEDAPAPLVDGTENVRAFWATAREALDAVAAGHARMIFPTLRNVERLAQFDSHADAARHAMTTEIRTITPWEDGGFVCIPEGLGYPVTRVPVHRAMRA